MAFFKGKSFEYKKAAIEIIISITSTALVLFTLFEMQAARNASYRPDITLGLTQVFITWNTEITESNNPNMGSISTPSYQGIDLDSVPSINLYNIGVGTAKDIIISWNHPNNFSQFVKALEPYNDIQIQHIENNLYVETRSQHTEYGLEQNTKFDFMLSSSEEYYTIKFPIYYFNLYKELFIRTPYNTSFPRLSLTISYTDIQNKSYSKNISVHIKPVLYEVTELSNGSCHFLLEFVEEDNSMSTFGPLIITGDTLSAIASICAVIVSIISIIFTVYYSKKQNEHNRNSVRPISAIKVKDYEDLISVSIDNVGTGPLLVTSLRVQKAQFVGKDLISLMPSINQSWTTFSASIDNWTIPVGGTVTLLELQPENESVKMQIRKELSICTVYLDYTDIYSTKFQDKRALDFFGRHFE